MQTSDAMARWQNLHPAMFLFGMGSILKNTIFPLLIGGYAAAQGSIFVSMAILVPMVCFPLIGLLMRFISYRYALAEGHITIREGVFSKKIRRIPVKRIHNINTHQNLFARWFKVVRLDIETAGGGASEASMPALGLDAARVIQEYVQAEKREYGDSEPDEDSQEQESRVLFRMPFKDLFIAGATTSRIGVIALFFVLIGQYFEYQNSRLMPDWIKDVASEVTAREEQQLLLLALAGFFALLVAAWIVNITMTVIRWYGFTLSESGSDLNIRTGLLTIRQFTMPLNKIQALECRTSPIRRPLSLFQIKVCSAGHVGMQNQKKMESDLLVPLTHRRHIAKFVKLVWDGALWDKVTWRPVHPYTRTRQFRTMFLMLLVGAGGLVAWLGDPNGERVGFVVLLLGTLTAWLIAHLTYKQTAYAFDENFAYLKTGFLGLHFWVIPLAKIQNSSLVQSPFQRIRNLVSLKIDVAGASGTSDTTIPNIPRDMGWLLLNRFGHPKLSATKKLQ